ncbi:FGGY-family carbohydrate kinase [Propionibacteriaceae bacterium G1746]|uniref:FGGY-family carbohydrate kinase n=1 Tax=Aestuariimicrobium sp. G57 TaxID=3418485 RepID=UPI003C17C49A
MSGQELVLGVDIGLTGMKVVAFNLRGEPVHEARETSPQEIPHPHWVERDGREYWALFSRMMRAVTTKIDNAGDTAISLALSAHGDGGWLVDEEGDAVRPGILSLDSRAIDEAAALNASSFDDLLRETGQGVGPASPGVILRWLKDNEPENYAKARWFIYAKDFLRIKLTDSVGTDLTEASTAFTDVNTQEYTDEAFRLYGVEEYKDRVPPINDATEVIGTVTKLAHIATGLPEGLPVVAGLHDVDAGAIGAGAVRPGQLAVMAGTWSINEVISDKPKLGKEWFCRAFVEKGTWMNMSISPASSANLEWFATTLCQADLDGRTRAGMDPYGFIDEEIAQTSDDDDIVTFLPFLYGNPMNIDGQATFAGLRAWHKRGHLLRAVYEGIAFNHRIHCDPLIEAFGVTDIFVVGGVTRSSIWPQMFADAMGKPIRIPVKAEGGALGTAMVAAVGAGKFANLAEAYEAMGSETQVIEPTPEGTARMQHRFERFMEQIEAQKSWWESAKH